MYLFVGTITGYFSCLLGYFIISYKYSVLIKYIQTYICKNYTYTFKTSIRLDSYYQWRPLILITVPPRSEDIVTLKKCCIIEKTLKICTYRPSFLSFFLPSS